MANFNRVELVPNDGRKSFYGKAVVIFATNGDHVRQSLQSYETIVGYIMDGVCKVFGTYSATTLRHIKAWLAANGLPSGSKQEIMKMYGEGEQDV